MDEKKEIINQKSEIIRNNEFDFLKLGNELTTRRYMFNKAQINKYLSSQDYIALHIIKEVESIESIYSGKTYLKDISERMQLSIRKTSKLVGELKDRGLVNWSHDGNGSEGTYVTITKEGEKLLEKQEEVNREFYGNVIKKYGVDNLIQLLNLMKQLETVMSSELEEMEGKEDDAAIE